MKNIFLVFKKEIKEIYHLTIVTSYLLGRNNKIIIYNFYLKYNFKFLNSTKLIIYI